MNHPFYYYYKTVLVPQYMEEHNIINEHKVPKIEKIIISRGIGKSNTLQVNNYVEESLKEFELISGQKPMLTRSKKHIAAFKVRKGMILGIYVTLRGYKMYAFLQKLIHLILPGIRQFQGLKLNNFDRQGNITFGIFSQSQIPELPYIPRQEIRGFHITLQTTARTPSQALTLCTLLGLPSNSI